MEWGKHITKREARNLFLAAKCNEQALYPAADAHYREHGAWPEDYLRARDETARAFERYADAGIFSGITVEADR